MTSEPLSTPQPSSILAHVALEPSSVLAHRWALSVFRVEDQSAQQRVLHALSRLGRADLTATAAQRGDETFVIIDWDVTADDAQHVVMVADRNAAMTFRSRERGPTLP